MSNKFKLAVRTALVLPMALSAQASAAQSPVRDGPMIAGKPPFEKMAGNMKVLRVKSRYCIVRDRGYCLYKPGGAVGSPCTCDKYPGRFGG